MKERVTVKESEGETREQRMIGINGERGKRYGVQDSGRYSREDRIAELEHRIAILEGKEDIAATGSINGSASGKDSADRESREEE